jgi:hypothetical protein
MPDKDPDQADRIRMPIEQMKTESREQLDARLAEHGLPPLPVPHWPVTRVKVDDPDDAPPMPSPRSSRG